MSHISHPNSNRTDGVHCHRCGKKLDPAAAVWLELDQRINEFHDFGGVPEDKSQGCFAFGPDCAEKCRAEAVEKGAAETIPEVDSYAFHSDFNGVVSIRVIHKGQCIDVVNRARNAVRFHNDGKYGPSKSGYYSTPYASEKALTVFNDGTPFIELPDYVDVPEPPRLGTDPAPRAFGPLSELVRAAEELILAAGCEDDLEPDGPRFLAPSMIGHAPIACLLRLNRALKALGCKHCDEPDPLDTISAADDPADAIAAHASEQVFHGVYTS